MSKIKILISGTIDLQTIGRQVIGFVGALVRDARNDIYIDALWENDNTYNCLCEIWGGDILQKVKSSSELPLDYEYDFLIYPWIFGYAVSEKFALTLKRNAKIKVCYPVYDGSMPPLEWVDIINKNFDICVTPSDYCAHNLKRFGVNIDCFGLEVVLLMNNFFAMKKIGSPKFRFGCLSASENRKNLPLLIESFTEAFKDCDDVELVVKTIDRHDIFAPIDELKRMVADKHSNITLITEFLNHQEMSDLIASMDVYVNPQKTVGFYPTSLEMMALGHPQILSDIPVHREVTKYLNPEGNIIFVPHLFIEPEFHAAFDYRIMGIRLQSNKENYVKAFREVYLNKDKYCSEKLSAQRIAAVKYYFNHTIEKYNQMLHPNSIVKSNYSHIDDGCFYMSKKLTLKYKNLYPDIAINKSTNNFSEIKYAEEDSYLFKAIEQIAYRDQLIYLQDKPFLNVGKDSIPNKYFEKINKLYFKHRVDVPYFIYKLYKIYLQLIKIKNKK